MRLAALLCFYMRGEKLGARYKTQYKRVMPITSLDRSADSLFLNLID